MSSRFTSIVMNSLISFVTGITLIILSSYLTYYRNSDPFDISTGLFALNMIGWALLAMAFERDKASNKRRFTWKGAVITIVVLVNQFSLYGFAAERMDTLFSDHQSSKSIKAVVSDTYIEHKKTSTKYTTILTYRIGTKDIKCSTAYQDLRLQKRAQVIVRYLIDDPSICRIVVLD